jgi:hypothetical protein
VTLASIVDRLRQTLSYPPWVFLTNSRVFLESWRDFFGRRPNRSSDNWEHIDRLLGWLCRAQDVAGDGGVSRCFTLHYHPYFRKRGWIASYPETTGYIVPTFFDLYHVLGRDDVKERAIRMIDWECAIQLESGAVRGGTVDFPPSPAVFNTGQVVFGWCRAFRETGDERYLEAATRAGDFLVESQDADGVWRRGHSKYARAGATVYNTRCSWALLVLASLANDGKYRSAAIRNLDWALTRQKSNGWFFDNCLDDPAHPLVHTIAYATQGLLEAGLLLGEDRYVSSAIRTAETMAQLLRSDGALAGRYDEDWRPAVSWSCLTGNMQMSIVWSRLHQTSLAPKLRSAAECINAFNRRLHDWHSSCDGCRGGVKGSFPIYGNYGRFEYLNWAAKFTIDALLREEKSRGHDRIRELEARGAPLFWAT